MDVRILLAQTNPTLGNVPVNLAEHIVQIEAALAAGAQIVLFPELSLTGYFLKDQTAELALDLQSRVIAELLSWSTKISIGVGFVERASDGRVFNSVAFLEDGRVVHVHRKVHLVTYGMFDEQREFAAGERFAAFDSKHGRFGFMICEDVWHVSSGYQLFLDNVDAMLVPSCGPGRGIAEGTQELGSLRVWRTLLEAHALSFQTWIVYVNRVGWEDGVFFSGGSCVVDPFGSRVASIEGLDPARLEARLTSRALIRARTATPLRRDSKPWVLAEGLRRLTHESGQAS